MTIITHSTALLMARPRPFVDVRCRNCNKLLFKWQYQGVVQLEVKCSRCSHSEVLSLST